MVWEKAFSFFENKFILIEKCVGWAARLLGVGDLVGEGGDDSGDLYGGARGGTRILEGGGGTPEPFGLWGCRDWAAAGAGVRAGQGRARARWLQGGRPRCAIMLRVTGEAAAGLRLRHNERGRARGTLFGQPCSHARARGAPPSRPPHLLVGNDLEHVLACRRGAGRRRQRCAQVHDGKLSGGPGPGWLRTRRQGCLSQGERGAAPSRPTCRCGGAPGPPPPEHPPQASRSIEPTQVPAFEIATCSTQNRRRTAHRPPRSTPLYLLPGPCQPAA